MNGNRREQTGSVPKRAGPDGIPSDLTNSTFSVPSFGRLLLEDYPSEEYPQIDENRATQK